MHTSLNPGTESSVLATEGRRLQEPMEPEERCELGWK